MINYVKGDIFDSAAEAWVNPVNCVGVMGKGLAKDFKLSFPENYALYREACNDGKIKPGKIHIYICRGNHPKYVVNFPTKKHWRNPSKIEYIQRGLEDLSEFIVKSKIKSVAIPALGCGLGGLDWEIVSAEIECLDRTIQYFADDIELEVYVPR